MRLDPDKALEGYDGRVVYADTLTSAVYALLTPSMRAEVRRMVETEWSGALELKSGDMDGLDVTDGEFRISDCVARVKLEFGGTEGDRDVVIGHQEAVLRGVLPDTVLLGVRRRDLADLIGHEVARGIPVREAENRDGSTVLRYSQDVTFLIDELGTPFASREKKRKA